MKSIIVLKGSLLAYSLESKGVFTYLLVRVKGIRS